ncbi:MAG TPA: AAA family ATPase [Gemmatimonadales bacterium]|nr:AAA family ATPase [Gemmatimonadales bacterium]
MIVCRTLGPIEVTVDGAPAPPELLWRKHLALLVYLARSPRQTRSREHLTGLLWADRNEAAARHSLSEALRVIRRHAGQLAVEATVGQLGLTEGAVELDVDRLEQLADAGDWTAASELVAGEFLEGFGVPDATAFEDWLATERELWRRRGVEILVRCADALARSGEAQEACAVAARALAIEPLSEMAFRASLRCLALAGDRTGALELSDRFHERLAEMGVQPDEETRALVARVRRERGVRRDVQEGADELSLLRPPLGGRTEELARLLEEAARSARSRRSVLVLLEGEPGVGKSRLLGEALTLLRLDGTSVAAARAVEGDRADPWSGVLALARGGLIDAAGIGGAPPSALASFGGVLAEWSDRFPGARSPAGMALGRALVEAVRAAASEHPVVLAVDDAQWLDADSALSLGTMLRDLQTAPLTLVLSTSPYPPRAELDELRSRIGRDLDGGVVRLRRLDRAALRSLAERMLPGYDSISLDRVVRRVATDSAGLPLLAVELLRAVALGLDLGTIAGTWPEPLRTLDQSLPGDLPDAVVAAIRVAFRRLSPAAQRVLVSAAVLGDLAAPPVLEHALEMEPDELGRALDELEWHRWLVTEPRGYSFAARIVRQVVERDMVTPGQRRRVLEAAGRSHSV